MESSFLTALFSDVLDTLSVQLNEETSNHVTGRQFLRLPHPRTGTFRKFPHFEISRDDRLLHRHSITFPSL